MENNTPNQPQSQPVDIPAPQPEQPTQQETPPDPQQPAPANEPPKKKKSLKLIIILSVVLVVLVVFGIVYAFYIKPKNTPVAQPTEEATGKVLEKKSEETTDKTQTIKKEAESLKPGMATAANSYGFEFSYPTAKIKYYNESEAHLFCEAGSPDDINIVYGNQIKFGCIEIESSVHEEALKDHIDFITSSGRLNIANEYYTLKSKEKINLGGKEAYRIIYWKGDKAGVYMYVMLSGTDEGGMNKSIVATYGYDDYSIRNKEIIPIYEDILSSAKVSQ